MTTISLDGRAVIVTGASRGMGREMADALLGAGARVGVLAEAADELAATRDALAAAHGEDRVIALPCDISEYEQCAASVASTIEAFGHLFGLVNHAGLGPLQVAPEDADDEHVPFWVPEPARWDRLIEVNVIGTYFMARAAVPEMLARGAGRIVNVTTSLPNFQRKYRSPYGCSKAGIESETLIFAQDLAGTGVTCNSLIPGGAVRTRFVPEAMHAEPRLLDPDIMRAPIVWLMSDAAEGHTGERFNARYWDTGADAETAWKGARTVPAYRTPPAGTRVRT